MRVLWKMSNFEFIAKEAITIGSKQVGKTISQEAELVGCKM